MTGAKIREFSPEAAGSEDDDWRMYAACESVDPALFFPVGTTGLAAEQILIAKEYCGTCAVRRECLNFALVTRQEHGIWGGTTEEQRMRYRKVWLAQRQRT